MPIHAAQRLHHSSESSSMSWLASPTKTVIVEQHECEHDRHGNSRVQVQLRLVAVESKLERREPVRARAENRARRRGREHGAKADALRVRFGRPVRAAGPTRRPARRSTQPAAGNPAEIPIIQGQIEIAGKRGPEQRTADRADAERAEEPAEESGLRPSRGPDPAKTAAT